MNRMKPTLILSLSLAAMLSVVGLNAHAGAQQEEKLSASVQAILHHAIADQAAPKLTLSLIHI